MPNALISTALALLWSQLLFAHGQDYARMFFFQILIFGSGALGAVLFFIGLNVYFWNARSGGVCMLSAGVFVLIAIASYVLVQILR